MPHRACQDQVRAHARGAAASDLSLGLSSASSQVATASIAATALSVERYAMKWLISFPLFGARLVLAISSKSSMSNGFSSVPTSSAGSK